LEEHKSGKGARFLAQKYGVSQQFVYRLISKGSPDDEACTPEAARKKADNYDWVDHLNVE
jgi:transposase